MDADISLKGTKDGLLVTVGEGEWSAVCAHLLTRLLESGDFFRGAHVILQAGARPLGAVELGRLRDMLSEQAVVLHTVLSDSPLTESTARSFGLKTALPVPASPPEAPIDPEEPAAEAVVVRRTLRSGRSVHHTGHVTVIGDVNPGAEIVAGGNVVVWGRLRGTVHAGADGDEGALVCALDLAPSLLRIAGRIATSPPRKGNPVPEVARVREGRIVAEQWDSGRDSP